MRANPESNYRSCLLLAAACILIVAIYLPGLTGPLVFDDYVHIIENPAIAIDRIDITNLKTAALYNRNDPLGRPLASLSFALNHYLAGGTINTRPFKITNLFIHLVNTGLVYWLSLLLLRQLSTKPRFQYSRLHAWLPGLIAATWALHPIQLTTVLYVVQRMTSLSALFVFAGIIVFVHGRLRVQDHRPFGYILMGLGLLAGLTLGLASKENAALLPLFIIVIEYVFFAGQFQENLRLRRFYMISIFAPCLLAVLWLLSHPGFILETYIVREFSLLQRLLTEPRVLWFYVSLFLVASPSRLSLVHDDIPISTGLFEPWTTIPALLGLILVTIVGLTRVKKQPVVSFAILWFLAGHAMESTVIGLEIAHEHRNYLPTFGATFGIVYGLTRCFERFRTPAIAHILFPFIAATLAFSTYTRAHIWKSEESIITHLVRHHPGSARAHIMAAQLSEQEGNIMDTIAHYMQAATLAPHEPAYLLRFARTIANTAVAQLNPLPETDGTMSEPGRPKLPESVTITRSGEGLRLELTSTMIDEITEKLRTQPVHSRTAQGLSELTECVTTNRVHCDFLYSTLVHWYEVAIENPRTTMGVRKDMLITLVTTYMAYNDYANALQIAKKARSLDPLDQNFVLMEADAYFRLDELDNSEELLQSLRTSSVPVSAHIEEQTDSLSNLIKERRNHAKETDKTKRSYEYGEKTEQQGLQAPE